MFLRLNGWPVSIRDRTVAEDVVTHGENPDSYSGRPRRERRGIVRELSMETTFMSPEDADTLSCLIEGRGHHVSFNGDAFSDSGIGPELGGGYTIVQRRFGASPSGVHGTHYLSVSTTITWDFGLPEDAWTVAYFRSVTGGGFPGHVVVRSDGARWLNGVRDDALTTPELLVAGGLVQLSASLWTTYDDLVALPVIVSSSFAEALFRWTATLDVDLPLGLALHNVNGGRSRYAPTTSSVSFDGTSPLGHGISMTGSSDRLEYSPVGGHFWEQTEVSIEVWCKPTSSAGGFVVRRTDPTVTLGWFLTATSTAGGVLLIFTLITTGVGGIVSATTSVALELDVWSHVVVTWKQSTGEARIFVNGTDVTDVGSSIIAAGEAPDDETSEPLVIGNESGGGGAFPGSLSGFRMWRVALTTEEIVERHRAGLQHGRRHPGGLQSFSPLPAVHVAGDVTGWAPVVKLAEVTGEAVLPLGGGVSSATYNSGLYVDHGVPYNGVNAWRSNRRAVSFSMKERAIAEPPFPFSPLSLWRFSEEETVGVGQYDVERRLSASFFGAPHTYEPGPFGFGRGLSFDGAGGTYKVISDTFATILQGRRAFSVAAWVRVDESNAAQRAIFSCLNGSGNDKIFLGVTASNFLHSIVRPTGTDTTQTTSGSVVALDDGFWHLVGASFDIANDRVLIAVDGAGLDGGEVATSTPAFTATTFDGSLTSGSARIGRTAASEFWFGGIAALAFFDGYMPASAWHRIWKTGQRGMLLGRKR